MFNFTTQTIFNTVNVATVADIRDGKAVKDYNVVDGTSETAKPEVRFGNVRFDAANVESIAVAHHTDENLAKVTFDMSKLVDSSEDKQKGSYRIALYLGLSMNSQDSFYANDLVYKGKPLYIEFPVKGTESAKTIASRVVGIAKKYMLLVAQERILNIRVEDETKVVIEAVNGYQQLKVADLQKYDPAAAKVSCCGETGDYVTIIHGVPVVWTATLEDGVTVGEKKVDGDGQYVELENDEVAIEPGLEAFLDYNWIMHNLRLPTLANTNIWAPTKNEQPVVGGKYNQYIIRLCKERDGIAGEILGQRATTVTTHVLYVLDNENCGEAGGNTKAIEDLLEQLVEKSKWITDADDKYENPFPEAAGSEETETTTAAPEDDDPEATTESPHL